MPCATQNELNGDEAQTLIANGCFCVAEGANMPSTPEAIKAFLDNKLLYSPGKASNAGGVATSGLEMTQNSMRLSWSPQEVDQKLHSIMKDIHAACVKYGTGPDGYVNYVNGANIAGFMKVAIIPNPTFRRNLLSRNRIDFEKKRYICSNWKVNKIKNA